ncbi:hypothetical protein N7537_001723 [Penicillium hordei]|uniref:Uncharacterized protein n=1 Tax=Penicillium hordei TaxID=40994 RepID=A0AAD6EG02_9EURO|nr:uncharacterized protein N7537_001723 [Penicillium hordei]KAJ5616609.1 hypothetical protein N7537_001723 [Penicillium hordei]
MLPGESSVIPLSTRGLPRRLLVLPLRFISCTKYLFDQSPCLYIRRLPCSISGRDKKDESKCHIEPCLGSIDAMCLGEIVQNLRSEY